MKNVLHSISIVVVGLAGISWAAWAPDKTTAQNQTAVGSVMTVKGYLRDTVCPLRYKASMKPEGSCAMDCVKAGAPLGILTKEGVLYTPISDSVPEKDVRPLLMTHFGKYVAVTGEVFERGGTRAIAVRSITDALDNQ